VLRAGALALPGTIPRGLDRVAVTAAARTAARRAAADAAVLAGSLGLAAIQTGLFFRLGTRTFAGPDPVIDIWTLGWVSRHLLGGPSRLFDGNIFFPAHDTVLFSDPLLGPALLVQPLLVATSNPVLLYNAAVLLVLALTSHGLWRLARALGADAVSALLPAVAVPYCAHQLRHLTQLNLIAICGLPWLLLAVLSLLERPGWRTAAWTALAFAWQAATSGYQAFTAAVLCLTVAAWGWRALARPRTIAFVVLAVLAAGLIVGPYVAGFARLHADERLERPVDDIVGLSLSLPDDLLRTQAYAWRWLGWRRGDSAFPGFVVLALAVAAGMWVRGRTARLLWLVAGVFLVLALGPDLMVRGHPLVPLPYRLFHHRVPLLQAGRHPVTFVIAADLALGVLAALGLSALRLPLLWRILALALAFLETLAPTPKRVDRGPLPEAYAWLVAHGAQAVAELPYDEDAPQFWAAQHSVCTTAGISPYSPAAHMQLAQRISHEWKRLHGPGLEKTVSLAYFKRHIPVTHLLVNPGASRGLVREVEATQETFTLLHQTREGARIYRVRRGGQGPLIRRDFRDDQVRGATLEVRLSSPAGVPVRVDFNGRELARTGGGPARLRLVPPAAAVRRGANEVAVAAADGRTSIELVDIAAGGLASAPCR